MKTTKHILSVLILFSIFGGITHNLFPHCQDLVLYDSYTDERSEHHHHKHQIDLDNKTHLNHSHKKHDNHVDEGIYDYVKCILVDVEIPHDNCNLSCFIFWNQKETINYDIQFPNNIFLESLHSNLFNHLKSSSLFTTFRIDINCPPILKNTTLRGPPSIPC